MTLVSTPAHGVEAQLSGVVHLYPSLEGDTVRGAASSLTSRRVKRSHCSVRLARANRRLGLMSAHP